MMRHATETMGELQNLFSVQLPSWMWMWVLSKIPIHIYILYIYIYVCVYIYPTWCPQLAATSHLQRTLVPGCEIRGRHAGHSGTADRNIVQFLVTHHIPQYRHLKLGSPILQHSRVSIGWSKMVQIIFSKVVHPINIHQLVSPRSFVGLVSPH